MRESLYSSLRAEILAEQSAQANLLIAMYTIFITIITFAIAQTNTYLFLVAILVILLFKLQILWKQVGMERISAYIIVNFEANKKFKINWESDIMKAESFRIKKFKRWFKFISISSSKMSSILIILTYTINIFILYHTKEKSGIVITEIVLGFIGVFITLCLDILQPPEKLKNMFIKEFVQLNLNKGCNANNQTKEIEDYLEKAYYRAKMDNNAELVEQINKALNAFKVNGDICEL